MIVQVPSRASVIDAAAVRHLANASPDFRSLIVKYEQFLMGQVQQTTACNALHSVEARTCKWLVRMYDLAGNDLPLTQEFLAQMMGVQRTSVSGVAIRLQDEGLIEYHRGKVRILNIDAVQGRVCECREAVREHYLAMFGKVQFSLWNLLAKLALDQVPWSRNNLNKYSEGAERNSSPVTCLCETVARHQKMARVADSQRSFGPASKKLFKEHKRSHTIAKGDGLAFVSV